MVDGGTYFVPVVNHCLITVNVRNAGTKRILMVQTSWGMATSLPYFGVKLSRVCLKVTYR